jgi:hypothetical protein
MIVHLNRGESPYKRCEALNKRAWKYSQDFENMRSGTTAKKPTSQTFGLRKIAFTLPFLWLSGFFTGLATILWTSGQ